MARSRNIKPGFFTNEDMVELDFATRLLFAGLWTVADREGRLQDRPKKIKIDVFPADNVDVDVMLQALHERNFIVRYEVDGAKYVQITNWSKHQNPHHTEKVSEIPGFNGDLTVKQPLKTCDSPMQDGEYLADSLLLIPDSGFLVTDSLIPDSIVVPAIAEKPEAKKKKSKLPDDFEPNDTCSTKAESLGLDLLAELEQFRNHHNANGTLMLDWQAAMRTWLGNATKFQRKPLQLPNRQEAIEKRNHEAAERWASQGEMNAVK